MDYAQFLDAVFLFRSLRHMDSFPETWTQRKLDTLASGDEPREVKDMLSLAAKMAEAIDDYKGWLLEEMEAGLLRVKSYLWQPA